LPSTRLSGCDDHVPVIVVEQVAPATDSRRHDSRRRQESRRRRPQGRGWIRGLAWALALMLVPLTVFAAWAAVGIQGEPSSDDLPTRAAEWARDNGLGAVVTGAEELQYRLNPPKVGGTPDLAALNSIGTAQLGAAATAAVHSLASREPVHAPIATPVTPALPHEGQFAPIGPGPAGRSIQISYVRPDSVHTSYLTGIAWISGKDRFVLHPGQADPAGSHWSQAPLVLSKDRASLLATFNGGFKMKDSRGGYYDHGVTAGTLTQGAASLVITKDGRATVGQWGTDVGMAKDVAFVRQNLKPLIEHGVVAKDLAANVESNWGTTVGGHDAVWRSGLGMTKSGDLVYVMGDALTVASLADVLQRAGAYNAMQLDINRAWVSFDYYRSHAGRLTPHKLGSFQRPADRYLQPVSRDFVAVYAAPASATGSAQSTVPTLSG
jgi:hypothetical protein